MKKLLLGVSALFALAGPAFAADLAPRPYTKAPAMVAEVYNWTGFYIGVQGGYSDGVGNHTILVDGTGFLNAPFGPTKIKGGNYGGVVGYDYQFSPNWVVGVNTEFNGGRISGLFDNGIAEGGGPGSDDIFASSVRWFGSTRLKLGFVMPTLPSVMIYGNAGVAYASIHGENGDGLDGVSALNCALDCGIGTTTKVGYTVGAGISWMIPNTHFVLTGEYGYYDFGRAQISTTTASGNPHVFDVDTHFNTGRGVLSYKF
jgi:outer membrane immunogenic protein